MAHLCFVPASPPHHDGPGANSLVCMHNIATFQRIHSDDLAFKMVAHQNRTSPYERPCQWWLHHSHISFDLSVRHCIALNQLSAFHSARHETLLIKAGLRKAWPASVMVTISIAIVQWWNYEIRTCLQVQTPANWSPNIIG